MRGAIAIADATSIEQFLLAREQFGMQFGLDRMRRLLAALGEPEDAFPAVHVVGTNGKSSTVLLTAAALRAQGISAGSFTSPHLLEFRERIEVDDQTVDHERFAAAGAAVRDAILTDDQQAAPDDRVTQFEAITAIALCVFRDAAVDVAVVEAGLGGRLDATNALGDSRVQVLTGVGIDHTQYLGETLEEIAREKLAVVRSGAILVSGPLGFAVDLVANAMSDERNARWHKVESTDPIFDSLNGQFVRENASLALVIAETAYSQVRPGSAFVADAAVTAISALASEKGIAGRLQITNAEPFEIRDAAHNAQAAEALVVALGEVAGDRPVTMLLGMLDDKPLTETLTALLTAISADGVVVCTQSSNPRALAAATLAERVGELSEQPLRVETVDSPHAALGRAREVAGRSGLLCVTGSNYLLADLLRDPSAPAGATF